MKRTGLLPALLLCLPAGADQWQSLQSIRSAAEQHAMSSNPAPGLQVQAAALDSRLQLARCNSDLQTFTVGSQSRNGNMTVGVRCVGPQSWKLYVPVRAVLQTRVLVAKHALGRGQSLTMADLQWSEHDANRLPYGFIDRIDQIENAVLKRPVTPGTVLIPAMFDRRQLIKRGQQVRLVAGKDGVRISMAGQALSDGALHQRIRVTNLSSGRVVEGIVLSGETIEIRRH